MDGTLNPFTGRELAERYARSRPYFHPIVVSRLRRLLGWDEPLPCVLDIGCGTGLSCLALGTDLVGLLDSISAELTPDDLAKLVAEAELRRGPTCPLGARLAYRE